MEEGNKSKIKYEASKNRKEKIEEISKQPGDEVMDSFKDEMIEKERGGENRTEEVGLLELSKNYYLIKETLEKYVVMKKEYYSIIAIWIIGTYFHENFSSFPYLFLNAMRGSGKTRTLKLITKLSKDGNVMASPTEAVLFRTKGVLGIDEFENVGNKDKNSIRELLNSCYKKGTKIFRIKKKKTPNGEEQVVEEFEPYRPIIMANISGMEEVLGDRCISLILEKSNCPVRTMLIEDFDDNETIKDILENFRLCSLCSVVTLKNIYRKWNEYVLGVTYNIHTYTTLTTLNNVKQPPTTTLPDSLTTPEKLKNIKEDSFFNNVYTSGIGGRNLELFLPLFFIANMVGDDVFKELLGIGIEISKDKFDDEEVESKDVQVFDFVSKMGDGSTYVFIKDLTEQFKQFIGYEYSSDDNWLNSKWFGRALKRLDLIIDKRRVSKGVEVTLNNPKAKSKLLMWDKK